MTITDKITNHLNNLAPHCTATRSASLLTQALEEIENLQSTNLVWVQITDAPLPIEKNMLLWFNNKYYEGFVRKDGEHCFCEFGPAIDEVRDVPEDFNPTHYCLLNPPL